MRKLNIGDSIKLDKNNQGIIVDYDNTSYIVEDKYGNTHKVDFVINTKDSLYSNIYGEADDPEYERQGREFENLLKNGEVILDNDYIKEDINEGFYVDLFVYPQTEEYNTDEFYEKTDFDKIEDELNKILEKSIFEVYDYQIGKGFKNIVILYSDDEFANKINKFISDNQSDLEFYSDEEMRDEKGSIYLDGIFKFDDKKNRKLLEFIENSIKEELEKALGEFKYDRINTERTFDIDGIRATFKAPEEDVYE